MPADLDGVRLFQLRHEDLDEPVEERLGQPLPSGAVLGGVLGREDLGVLRVQDESAVELWDVDFASVVETSVEALEHALRRQVQLVQENPCPGSVKFKIYLINVKLCLDMG